MTTSKTATSVSRGLVVWAYPDPGFSTLGREQDGRRPVLIVASSTYLQAIPKLVLAIPVTTRDHGWRNHVRLAGDLDLKKECFAMTEQVRAISRSRLGTVAGAANRATMAQVDIWLRDFLQVA